jgi:hypothetical protein
MNYMHHAVANKMVHWKELEKKPLWPILKYYPAFICRKGGREGERERGCKTAPAGKVQTTMKEYMGHESKNSIYLSF